MSLPINITEHNVAMYGIGRDRIDLRDGSSEYAEQMQPRTYWYQEKCMSGEVMQKPMTLAELHAAVRALLPPTFTVFTDVSVKTYSHRPDETDVIVSVWVQPVRGNSAGHAVDGDTCEQVLEKVKAGVLPALGLVDVAPAAERLAAMGV